MQGYKTEQEKEQEIKKRDREEFRLRMENDMLKQDLAEARDFIDDKNRINAELESKIRILERSDGETNKHTLLEVLYDGELTQLRDKVDRMEKQMKEERERHAVALLAAYDLGLMSAMPAREGGNSRTRSSIASVGYSSAILEELVEQ